MKFYETFFQEGKSDVLLIQPAMLQKIDPVYIDPVQTEYWKCLEKVGSLFGDLPIEPNWGLLYIASNLKKHGYSVSLLDFHLYDYIKFNKFNEFINDDDIIRILKLKKFKIVGISSMTLSHENALSIAKACKEINPECIVVLGGIHFSFLAEETMKENPWVDGIIVGEGEEIFVKLAAAVNQGYSWKSIPGITCRDKDEITVCEDYKLIEDLDSLPYPDYDLWPEDVPVIPRIYTARGCNGGCSYCVVNQFFSGKHRQRNIKEVFHELVYVTSKIKCNNILLGDLNLGASKASIMQLCDLIVNADLKIKWWCQTRPDSLDENLIKKMAEAGCVQIGIGIESANDEILDAATSRKENTKLSKKELCLLIKKYGIEVQGYFILGLPGETMSSAMKTIGMIDDLTKNSFVDVTHIAVLVPYPGTPIYKNEKDFDVKIISKDFSKYLMNCDFMNAGVPVVRTAELSQYQIYSLWQLALSTAANNFANRLTTNRPDMFNEVETFMEKIKFKKNLINHIT